MKKNSISSIALAICLALSSCNGASKPTITTQMDTSTPSPDPSTPADDIVVDTAENAEGKIMVVNFNNTKGTVTLYFDNKKIELKQDSTATGVGAHNDHYQYNSWHGETELKMDGKVIFSAKA